MWFRIAKSIAKSFRDRQIAFSSICVSIECSYFYSNSCLYIMYLFLVCVLLGCWLLRNSLSKLLEPLSLLSGCSPFRLTIPVPPFAYNARVRFILQFGLRVRLGHELKHTKNFKHTTIPYVWAKRRGPRTTCLMVKSKQPTAKCILAKATSSHTHTRDYIHTHTPTAAECAIPGSQMHHQHVHKVLPNFWGRLFK